MAEWSVPGYTALRQLGEGGFGEVLLARHDATGTLVAIKYLRHNLLVDRGFADMFRGEAEVLASLNDPNIVRLYEYVESPAGAAIVMELVDGVTLSDILTRAGSTTAEAALVVLQGSLLGLAAAHRRGVVHRDYKPANVLINGDGVSKLTDFGIAVRAGDHPIPAGTLLYAAPEQIAGAPASPASDVYSATATFYECLTGHPPFTGEAVQLLYKHSMEPVPLEPVPEPLRPLVTAGMAKDPQSRPADAASFVTSLRAVASGSYGQDWADRGRSHLGEAALLLAALWPSAATPAAPSLTVHRLSPVRRVISRVGTAKAAIAIGAAAVVVAGGAAVASGLVPLSSGHPAGPHRTKVAAAHIRPGHIIFLTSAAGAGHPFWRIHEISPRGAGASLLPVGDALCCGTPALSPDGTELVFTGEGRLDVIDLNGRQASGLWRRSHVGLTTPTGAFLDPVWSPSGKQIAFIYLPGNGQAPEIDVINADGTGRHAVIKSREISASGSVAALAWSQDGSQLAFATTLTKPQASPGGIPAGGIAVVGTSGGPVHTILTRVLGGVISLSWAPGPLPLFSNGHQPGISEANGHGGAKPVLLCGTCLDFHASWAPDGVHFAAVRAGKGVIVASVGKGVQATFGPADVTYVQWGGGGTSVPPKPEPSTSRPPTSAPPSRAGSLTQFKVCISPALTCTSSGGPARMKTEPTQIVTTGDGSGYVKNLTWSGWGNAQAVGTGVLEVDDCNPNCASGSFTGYPATITLSGLTPFGNGKRAYSVMTISAASAPSPQEAFTAGLVP
jgi:hypothetical protein